MEKGSGGDTTVSDTSGTPIFPPWDFGSWKAVDDRVRGGSSVSHLEAIELGTFDAPSSESEKAHSKVHGARFCGHLDIDTLGGAGFASQRYMFGPLPLELPPADYRGLCLELASPPSDGPSSQRPGTLGHSREPPRQTSATSVTSLPIALRSSSLKPRPTEFTLVLKTSLSSSTPPDHPRVPPEPQPASLVYETRFTYAYSPELELGSRVRLCFGFEDFKATYRGREIDRSDPRWQPLHSEKIYEMSIMCRSGFGRQSGEFDLVIASVAGWPRVAAGKLLMEAGWVNWTAWWYDMWMGAFGLLYRWLGEREGPVRLDEDKS